MPPPPCELFIATSAEAPGLSLGETPTFLNGINLAWVRYPDFAGSSGAGLSEAALPSVCGVEEAMRFLVAKLYLLTGLRVNCWRKNSIYMKNSVKKILMKMIKLK